MPNIKLKNQNGVETIYNGIESISIPTDDGQTAIFHAGATVDTEEKTIELSFTDGDQEITPSEGKQLSKVTITKPSTLLSENIKDGVVVAGIEGSLDINQKFNDYRAHLTDFGSASYDGEGCVIISPDKCRVQVWGQASNLSWTDYAYKSLLDIMTTDSDYLNGVLSLFGSVIMDGSKTNFENIFSGAQKALFMDTPCDVPTILTDDLKTWAGFLNVLKRSLTGLSTEYVDSTFMDPYDYIISYGGSSTQLNAGDCMSFPFIWKPAVEDGDPVLSYYILQNPTGTMPTYDQGTAIYTSDSDGMIGCVNAIPAYGITNPFFAYVMPDNTTIIWRSEGAQTIPEAFLQAINSSWGSGSVTIPQGWSITTITGDSTTTQAVDETMFNTLRNSKHFSLTSFSFDTMDEYTKSFFEGIEIQKYKPLNNKSFVLEFNLVGASDA